MTASQRFEIVRRLGRGGMGVVYEALDRDLGGRVALKTLEDHDPTLLLRLKHEFRTTQEALHPNLVAVRELIEDVGRFYVVMELVEGVDFLAYVRPSAATVPAIAGSAAETLDVTLPTIDLGSAPRGRRATASAAPVGSGYDRARLCAALVQLTSALQALHRLGKIHCDVKPSNILVTPAGRLVLLDFGLARDAELDVHVLGGKVSGTVPYLAPEQVAGHEPDAAVDFYAVGVLLYVALSGRLPFHGPSAKVLREKQHFDPSPIELLVPEVDHDLAELTAALLVRDPARRASGADILRVVGGDPVARGREAFVGRERELADLAEGERAVQAGAAVAVAIRGESGIGKSALVRTFLAGVRRADPGSLIVSSRCHPLEAVPYKAVDALIDGLSEFLDRGDDPPASLAAHLGAAAAIFPALQRHLGPSARAAGPATVVDPQEQRARAFTGVRQVFRALAAARKVIIAIDDLQWADADSLALLDEILRPPEAPAILLLVTSRTGGDEAAASWRPRGDFRELVLRRFDQREAFALAGALDVDLPDVAELGRLAEQSGGHPMFLDQLLRSARRDGHAGDEVDLDTALWETVRAMASEAQAVVELTALAGGRLAWPVLAHAAGLAPEQLSAHVAHLRAARLVRLSGSAAHLALEPYHDRVREAVLGRLAPARLAAGHRRLAEALALAAEPDVEALAIHWQGAGELAVAAGFALRAAERAAESLAFEHAARLFRLALALAPERSDAASTWAALGETLANGGRSADAGQAYLEAARRSDGDRALDHRWRAADQLLRAGEWKAGRATLAEVLAEVGLPMAGGPRRTLARLLWRRARLALRGVRFRERSAAEVAPEVLRRIDVAVMVGFGMALVDPLVATDFHAIALLTALRAGEPDRIARELAADAVLIAVEGPAHRARAEARIRQAHALAARTGSAKTASWALGVEGCVVHQFGEFLAAAELFERADRQLRDRCVGVAWERASVQLFWLEALFYLGRGAELMRSHDAWYREAQARGDGWAQGVMRSGFANAVWLLRGDLVGARAAAQVAFGGERDGGFQMLDYYNLVARCQIDLYAGDGDAAWDALEAVRRPMRRSLLLRVETIRVETAHLSGRVALACAGGRRDAARDRLLARADREVRRIERNPGRWAKGLAGLLGAAVACARAEREPAIARLRAAIADLEDHHMALYAAAARQRLAALVGGEEGAGLAAEATAYWRREGIADPERVSEMLAPGLVIP